MSDRGEKVCMNGDKSKIVDCESAEAAFIMDKADADKILAETKAQQRSSNKARSADADK